MTKRPTTVALLCTLLPCAALADARGEKVIAQMDKALTAAKDQLLEMDMVIQDLVTLEIVLHL